MTRKIVNLGQSANIQNCHAIKEEILGALTDCEYVIIDPAEVQEVDITFFQTMYSAKVYASNTGKSIAFTDQPNEQIAAGLARTGLADLPSSANLNSWLHGDLSQ